MILLGSGDPPEPRILVFGKGLIGSAIAEDLGRRGFVRLREESLPWNDTPAFDSRLDEIERTISVDRGAPDPGRDSPDARWTVIWSAGSAGFDATEEQAAEELSRFRRIVAFAHRLPRRSGARPAVFAFIGSAGGLFEGQRVVDAASTPAPRRPYGRLKLAEEDALLSGPGGIEPAVFRLSSVYGPLAGRHRRGLIPTLIANAFEGRVSRINGTSSTLRDFVWVRDVARFVVSRILESPGNAREKIVTLASCRPASILEIRKLVEDALDRRLYVSFVPAQSNREDITFRPTTMPAGWNPSPLKTNIGLIARTFLAAGGPVASPSWSSRFPGPIDGAGRPGG
jgi:UDP-glucose 4-epimerase